MMDLIRWNPAIEMRDAHGLMNRMFEGFFTPMVPLTAGGLASDWKPLVDVYEDDHNIVFKAELPGVDKKDISVDVKDGVLTLKGERNVENESKSDGCIRRERFYGRFERSFTLPAEVNPEAIKADVKDGVLKIEVPKPEVRKPKQITVH